VIGEGSYASVYRGRLQGQQVAVKKISLVLSFLSSLCITLLLLFLFLSASLL